MDTWTTDKGEMWLRDLLPNTASFGTSRIMTFGYDSDLRDRHATMTSESWAQTLLQYLSAVRTSKQVSMEAGKSNPYRQLSILC